MITINEFNDLSGGILLYLTSNSNVPWSKTEAHMNNILYVAHSGDKIVSPLLQKLIDNNTMTQDQNAIQQAIGSMFGDKWSRIYEALNLEYATINNYDMIEESTDEISKDGTTSSTNSSTDTLTRSGTVTNEGSSAANTQGNVFGYDSSTASPSDSSSSSASSDATQTSSSTDTDNTSSSTEGTTNEEETVKHTLTRKGNIGVTTSQQMLESEIVLRNKYKFWDIVFSDLDGILTLPIY